mgnify:CR=1 FL=1
MLQKIHHNLDWCTKNTYTHDRTDDIGRCVSKAAKLSCATTAGVCRFSFDFYFLIFPITMNMILTCRIINSMRILINILNLILILINYLKLLISIEH